MVILKNENAFTFISLLVSMAILFMVIPFIGYLIKSLDISDNYEALSVRQFFYYMRDEVANAVGYSVKDNTLILELANGDRVVFEHENQQIRRKLKDGIEIYLYDVHDVVFSPHRHGIHLSIVSLEGEHYEKIIVFYP